MSDEEQQNNWHLDKRVQVSHLLATAIAAISVVLYLTQIRQDIEVIKAQISATERVQRERDERQDKASAESLQLIREQLREMNSKLDRLIEKRGPV